MIITTIQCQKCLSIFGVLEMPERCLNLACQNEFVGEPIRVRDQILKARNMYLSSVHRPIIIVDRKQGQEIVFVRCIDKRLPVNVGFCTEADIEKFEKQSWK